MGVVADLATTARTYLGGGYPRFLYFRRDLNGHVPAFCYHDISGEEFESHLQYLAANAYRTLTCDELVQRVSAGPADVTSQSHVREVALTFDDGLATYYEEVYPLLRRYRMKAVAYIVPAWIGRPGFLTWDQCREMQASGWVDIQSHSYAHARVVTSATLTRVWHRSERSPIPWGVPGFDPSLEDKRIARLPVLEGASLFSGCPGLRIPDRFWHECTSLAVQEANGDIERHFKLLLQEHAGSMRRVDEAQLREWMAEDLQRSRAAIEHAIPGHVVRHFAFPWHANSTLAWQAVEAAGFVSAAVGLRCTDRSEERRAGLIPIFRVNMDFLSCLPGSRRAGFFRALALKAWRRAHGQDVYGIAT